LGLIIYTCTDRLVGEETNGLAHSFWRAIMAWNEKTMAVLRAWLGPSTSYKHHPIDNGRFYTFIDAIWKEQRKLWDEVQAREIIEREVRALHPDDYPSDLIAKMIEQRVSEGTMILDYLCHLKEEG